MVALSDRFVCIPEWDSGYFPHPACKKELGNKATS